VRQNTYSRELFDLSDTLMVITIARFGQRPSQRYGSQMIDGWFEKQVVKALMLVMLSHGLKRTD
jgi:hypothetical protein